MRALAPFLVNTPVDTGPPLSMTEDRPDIADDDAGVAGTLLDALRGLDAALEPDLAEAVGGLLDRGGLGGHRERVFFRVFLYF